MVDEVVAKHIDRLRQLLDATVRFESNYATGPPAWQGEPSSLAAGELVEATARGIDWENAARTVLSGVRLQLLVVSHHLKSISNLLGVQMPLFGPEILTRSAHETAARAWWLVDPAIGLRRRIARSLTDRLYSADYATALARDYGVDVDHFSEPPARVEATCEALGLTITGPLRRRHVDGEARPHATQLCTDLLRSIDPEDTTNRPSVAYPYYSAIAHGTYYALLHAFEDTGERWDGKTVLIAQVSLPTLVQAVELALAAFIGFLERLVTYMGWAPDMWEGWRDHVISVVNEIRPPIDGASEQA